jgi:hypothetical protein
MVLAVFALECHAGTWPVWLERAPLNTDSSLVGWTSAVGMARAWRCLAYLCNLAVLAGLVYGFSRGGADFSNFFYAYFGGLVGGIVLGLLLNPVIGAFSILPILVLTTGLIAWLCDLSIGRAALVGLAYHLYQIAYILIYKVIESRIAGAG